MALHHVLHSAQSIVSDPAIVPQLSIYYSVSFCVSLTPLNIELTQSLFPDPSQSLRRGLRCGLRAGSAFEEEAASESDYLHGRTAGGAGEGFRTHTLP